MVFMICLVKNSKSSSRYMISAQMKHRAIEHILEMARNHKYVNQMKHFKQQQVRKRQNYHFYDLFLLWTTFYKFFLQEQYHSIYSRSLDSQRSSKIIIVSYAYPESLNINPESRLETQVLSTSTKKAKYIIWRPDLWQLDRRS